MQTALGSLLLVVSLTAGAAAGEGRLRLAQDMPFDVAQADAATLGLRVDRLENQLRSLTGQNEQLQFQIKRLEESLRKFQEDVDFRFQDGAGGKPAPARPASPGRRSDLGDPDAPVVAEAPDAQPAVRVRRGAAFDPTTLPNAPGAPQPLGSTPPSAPLTRREAAPAPREVQPGAPMDLTPRGSLAAAPTAGSPGEPIVASIPQPSTLAPPDPAREAFNAAMAAFRAGQYGVAETGFSDFLQRFPKDRLAADATLALGDAFARRSRSREAAEQYLKVSTDFTKSPRAPEALVRLGQSLEKLGAKEQACAAYAEVGRKYPTASGAVRASADRESARVPC